MPQEFDQAQSASAGQEVGDIVESAGVQVDGTLMRWMPCLTTSNRCLSPMPRNMSVVSCKKAANDATAARQRQSFLVSA